jgi:hypothetical protein
MDKLLVAAVTILFIFVMLIVNVTFVENKNTAIVVFNAVAIIATAGLFLHVINICGDLDYCEKKLSRYAN